MPLEIASANESMHKLAARMVISIVDIAGEYSSGIPT